MPASISSRIPPHHLETTSFESHSPHTTRFHWGVFVLGFVLLVVGTSVSPWNLNWWGWGLGAAAFIALQSIFPTKLLGREHNLAPAIALGTTWLVGPIMGGWSALTGILLGYGMRQVRFGRMFPKSLLNQALSTPFAWPQALCTIGAIEISLIMTALSLKGSWRDSSSLGGTAMDGWRFGSQAGLFFLIYVLVVVLEATLNGRLRREHFLRELAPLALLLTIPMPFLMVVARSVPAGGVDGPLTFGVIATIVMVLINSVRSTQGELEARLKELDTVNKIGQVLRSTLELENLIAELQLQIRQYLRVDNFYVALHEREQERLWYPFAVKRGVQVYWLPRPVTDRLTDRVIRESMPILIPKHAARELPRIGLPVGEEPPFAWVGVPLISSDRTFGCLAVFSYSEEVTFGEAEAQYLSMISGGVSAAIENALLHKQITRGQAHINQVNQITTLLTGRHNPQEVLAQVCQSVAEVCHRAGSAIFLTSQEEGDVWLAQAHSLSDDILRANQRFSMGQDIRAQCLLTGQPVYLRSLEAGGLEDGLLELFHQEGIVALAEYPLITPEGPIGALSVYFTTRLEIDSNSDELLKMFAAQAALAVSSARLHARTDLALARRANQLSVLESVGRELGAQTSNENLFVSILDYAIELTNSNWGWLALYDPGEEHLVVKAQRGFEPGTILTPTGSSLSSRALRELRSINVPDVSREADFEDATTGQTRSALCVPLHNKERVLGVLMLESEVKGGYTLTDEIFINQLANQAAVALVNAELYHGMADARDRLRAVINSVREGILLIDPDGRLMLVNEFVEMLTSIGSDLVRGKKLEELPPEFLQACGFSNTEVEKVMDSIRCGEEPTLPKAAIRRQSGAGERVLERYGATVWGEEGKKRGWMLLMRDVTDEFQHAKERQLLTETLVHDLRSPMGTVLGALDVIEEAAREQPVEGNPLSLQAVNVARRGAQRILGLIDAVLEIARMEAGGVENELTWLAMDEIIAGVIAENLPMAQEYVIDLQAEEEPNLPVIYTDRGKLSRVIANLVDNALKFTPAGGKVRVITRAMPAQQIQVEVRDTGPGVPEEYREVIFERFKQVPGHPGRRRGSGLGLTFCKLAIEALGGKIWCENNPSGGSVFLFTLDVGGLQKTVIE